MDDGPQNATITVSVDDDGLAARLRLCADAEAGALDPDPIAAIARDQGIDVGDGVLARIAEAIRTFREDSRDLQHVIAEGAPARDGADGRIEWMPGYDPTAPGAGDPESGPGRVDHYNRIRYVRVREGAPVAIIHPPTAGDPGRDVRGRALPPTPGRPCPIRPGTGLRLEDGARVISERDGMLELAGDALSVSRLLEVRGSVDFSTGNISFDGSVTIGGCVRDLFEVRTTESIVIEGVVEAGRIEAGGNLVCRRGMAGKQHGHLRVGGQAEIGYLNLVRGVIEGDLVLQREAFNCRLTVYGRLLGDEATVIGGDSVFGRGIRVGQLGNERGVATTLVIGNVARLLRVRRLLERLEQQQADLGRQREKALTARSSRRGAFLQTLDAKMAEQQQRIQWAHAQLATIAPPEEDPPADAEALVDVRQALHPGVRLLIGDLEIAPIRTMHGPLTLRPQEDDLPCLSVAGVRRPVTTCMQVRLRGAGRDPAAHDTRKAG